MSSKKNIQVENTIPAGYTLDYVSGKQLKETNKELVRQRVVRALIHEYGFSPEDMDLDLSIGGRKKVDVAIFHHGKEHTIENLGRAVICRQEPNVGKNTVRIRDYEQAATDLGELETIMREVDAVQYGLWTNGLEFFFVEKEQKRFEIKCNPIGDWPMAEESVGTKDVISDAHMGQHSGQCGRVQRIDELRVIVERHAIGRHGWNRPTLAPLQTKQERAKERMIEQ
jgi:type I restriction enzyme M protein